ncbi:4621_t:CDS:2 [Paraglomus occultum]|uniref:4621_t:CDS:1 n=1 Tax=Paraglomus occultum TaxID=144539 RepID=A0A9N8Z732_9GLOM|nr:4621_t:CDS:2 [Paraglomus occultum]
MGAQNSTPRRRQFNITTDIPPEIFAAICEHLTPDDLFTLLRVCRYFRALLSANRSAYTQEIWRTSRLRSSDLFDHRPPPKGMSEQQYMLLHYWLTKCQFCRGQKEWESKAYWPFKVRACRSCLLERTISKHRLLNEWKIPKGVLSCLPYISIGTYEIYWISDVIQAEFRFRTIPPATRTLWATKHQERVRHYLQDVEEFELAYKYNMIFWYYKEQESIRKSCMVDDIAAELAVDPQLLKELPAYEEPLQWPPKERDWAAWRHKIVIGAQKFAKLQRRKVEKRWSL